MFYLLSCIILYTVKMKRVQDNVIAQLLFGTFIYFKKHLYCS